MWAPCERDGCFTEGGRANNIGKTFVTLMGKNSISLAKHNAKRKGAVRASSLVFDLGAPMSSSSVMAWLLRNSTGSIGD